MFCRSIALLSVALFSLTSAQQTCFAQGGIGGFISATVESISATHNAGANTISGTVTSKVSNQTSNDYTVKQIISIRKKNGAGQYVPLVDANGDPLNTTGSHVVPKNTNKTISDNYSFPLPATAAGDYSIGVFVGYFNSNNDFVVMAAGAKLITIP